MNGTVARLTLASLLGRRRALLLLVLPVVLLLLSVGARVLAGPGDRLAVLLLGAFALGTVVPLVSLITGTGSIGPEIDDGSIVYVLAKPLSRASIVVTKVVVAAGVAVAVGALPILLAGAVLTGSIGGVTAAFTAAAAAAAVAYCALFVLLAVLTRNAVVVGLIYALLWETLVGQLVPGAQALSIQQWALAVAEWLVGEPAERLGVLSAVDLGTSVLLVVVAVACTWYAGRRLRSLTITGEA